MAVLPDTPPGAFSSTVATSIGPTGAVQITATSGDVAGAASSTTATLAASGTKRTYISTFEIFSTGQTSGPSTVDVTVTDGVWTLTYVLVSVTTATNANMYISKLFNPPLRSTNVNSTIVITVPALGTGNLHCCINATGYQL